MALWGKTDALASAPKWIARKCVFDSTVAAVNTTAKTIDLTNANINFPVGEAVVYSVNGGTTITGLTDGSTYYVGKVDAYKISLYDTQANAVAGGATGRANITVVGVGKHTLTQTGAGNVNNHIMGAQALYFVDSVEAVQPLTRAKGIKNPGWWLYNSHSNADGSTGQSAECIVAMNGSDTDLVPATTGDQADDTVAADGIVIGTQPTAITGASTPYTGTFSVVATVAPSVSLTYQWQRSTDAGVTFANITNGGVFSTATTATLNLTAAAKATYNGNQFRCVVSAAGHTDVTSNAVSIAYA
jgi:hypothetical protein